MGPAPGVAVAPPAIDPPRRGRTVGLGVPGGYGVGLDLPPEGALLPDEGRPPRHRHGRGRVEGPGKPDQALPEPSLREAAGLPLPSFQGDHEGLREEAGPAERRPVRRLQRLRPVGDGAPRTQQGIDDPEAAGASDEAVPQPLRSRRRAGGLLVQRLGQLPHRQERGGPRGQGGLGTVFEAVSHRWVARVGGVRVRGLNVVQSHALGPRLVGTVR